MPHAAREVSEDTVHHVLLHGQVDDRLIIAVIDAGEFRLLGLLFHDLHLFHEFRRDVVGSDLGIVQEEGLAVDGDLGDGFTVGSNGAVLGDFDARKLLQQVHEHVVVADFEGGSVVLHRILLDDDGVAGRGDGSGVQHLLVQFHLDGSEVRGALHHHLGSIALVAHDFRLEGVLSVADLFHDTVSFMVGQGILGVAFFRGQGHRGEPHGLTAHRILQFHRHFVVLGLQRQGGEQAQDRQKNPSRCHTVRTNTHYSPT